MTRLVALRRGDGERDLLVSCCISIVCHFVMVQPVRTVSAVDHMLAYTLAPWMPRKV
jgi:hypothetical protein